MKGQRKRFCLLCCCTFSLPTIGCSGCSTSSAMLVLYSCLLLRIEGAQGHFHFSNPMHEREERERIRGEVRAFRAQVIRFLKRIQRISSHYYQKMERLSTHRRKSTFTVVDNFLTTEEAATLLQRYKPLLRESLHKTTTGDAKRSRYRTSRTVRLPPLGDTLVFDIQQRAVALQQQHEQSQNVFSSKSSSTSSGTGTAGQTQPHYSNNTNISMNMISLGHVEDLQLACYNENELYALHRDDNADFAAGRVATVLVYLQAPTAGGSTLFTHRPLEDERYQHQPLSSEADAVELFTQYCAHPEPHHTVVQAVTGRAVVWNSFMDVDMDNKESGVYFVRDSTHGACPVVTGEKCVVQQWLSSRSSIVNSLMDSRVVALFTAGAAVSFYLDHDHDDEDLNAALAPALRDSSARRGAGGIERLYRRGGTVATVVMEGPHQNVGALRLTGGGSHGGLTMTIEAPLSLFSRQGGLTVSFWVRRVQHGTTLMALKCGNRTIISASHHNYTEQGDSTNLAQEKSVFLRISESSAPESTFDYVLADPDVWLWCSMSYHGLSSTFRFACWSHSGNLLGVATTAVDAATLLCGDEEGDNNDKNGPMELVMLSAPSLDEQDSETASAAFVVAQNGDVAPTATTTAFVQRQTGEQPPPPPHADVSFIVVHDQILEPGEAGNLRRQVLRYDVHL